MGEARSFRVLPGQIGLCPFQRFGLMDGQAHQIVAEAGIELVTKACQLLAKESGDAFGLAQGAGGADFEPAHHPVHPEKREFEPAGAEAALFEIALQTLGETQKQAGDVLHQRNRLEEAPLGRQMRHRPAGIDRPLSDARCRVQPVEKRLAEAPGKPRPRLVQKHGHRLQAEAGEKGGHLRLQPQRLDGEGRHGRPLAAARHDERRSARRHQRHRRAGGARNRRARRKTLMEKPDEDVVHQGPLAALEMGAAGNVQDEAERRVEGDEGRIAIAPVGDRGEKPPIGFRIASQGLASRKAGARFRQAETGNETGFFGVLADRRDAIGIGRVAVKGEEGRRPALRRPSPALRLRAPAAPHPLAHDPVGGQPRQGEGEKAVLHRLSVLRGGRGGHGGSRRCRGEGAARRGSSPPPGKRWARRSAGDGWEDRKRRAPAPPGWRAAKGRPSLAARRSGEGEGAAFRPRASEDAGAACHRGTEAPDCL